jgi:hypothetical protein
MAMAKFLEVTEGGRLVVNLDAMGMLRFAEALIERFVESALLTGKRFNVERMTAKLREEIVDDHARQLEKYRPVLVSAGVAADAVFDQQVADLRQATGKFFDEKFLTPGPTHIKGLIEKVNTILEQAEYDPRRRGVKDLLEDIPAQQGETR